MYKICILLHILIIILLGVICTKHFLRNAELYEIYKRSHNLRMECGVYMQPKGEKCEDAYFISANGRSLGLADGI